MANDSVQFLCLQYQEKLQKERDSTKLYFQSIVILGVGIAMAIGALAALVDWKAAVDAGASATAVARVATTVVTFVPTVIFCGIPFFLSSWFGCYLFMYWEHHMMRLSLDYSEKVAAELLELPEDKVFLYHAEFLGVFNEASFPRKAWRVLPWARLKAAQVVVSLIGLPALGIYCFSGYHAYLLIAEEGKNPWAAAAYGVGLVVVLGILLGVHLRCVDRERTMKRKLGIESRWKDDELVSRGTGAVSSKQGDTTSRAGEFDC